MGYFSTYAVAEDYSGNRVMSVPSYYKSTTGNPQGTGSISFSTVTQEYHFTLRSDLQYLC